MAEPLTPRARQIVAVARELLEEEGAEALTMRRPGAYRAFALAHPHLYRLMTEQPLPRDLLPEGLEQRAAAPLLQAMGGDPARARAAFAFAHGMVMLELTQRLPPGEDSGPAWQEGIAALQARAATPRQRATAKQPHLQGAEVARDRRGVVRVGDQADVSVAFRAAPASQRRDETAIHAAFLN